MEERTRFVQVTPEELKLLEKHRQKNLKIEEKVEEKLKLFPTLPQMLRFIGIKFDDLKNHYEQEVKIGLDSDGINLRCEDAYSNLVMKKYVNKKRTVYHVEIKKISKQKLPTNTLIHISVVDGKVIDIRGLDITGINTIARYNTNIESLLPDFRKCLIRSVRTYIYNTIVSLEKDLKYAEDRYLKEKNIQRMVKSNLGKDYEAIKAEYANITKGE